MKFKEYKHYIIIVLLFLIIGAIIILNSNKEIGLIGVITDINKLDDSEINLAIEESGSNEIKNIKLDPRTIVYRGNKFMHISSDELKNGDTVQIIFKGKIDKAQDATKEVVKAIQIVE